MLKYSKSHPINALLFLFLQGNAIKHSPGPVAIHSGLGSALSPTPVAALDFGAQDGLLPPDPSTHRSSMRANPSCDVHHCSPFTSLSPRSVPLLQNHRTCFSIHFCHFSFASCTHHHTFSRYSCIIPTPSFTPPPSTSSCSLLYSA